MPPALPALTPVRNGQSRELQEDPAPTVVTSKALIVEDPVWQRLLLFSCRVAAMCCSRAEDVTDVDAGPKRWADTFIGRQSARHDNGWQSLDVNTTECSY